MKLYFSPASPYVRKVLACAIELGLDERIERLPSKAHPIDRDRQIVADNPLGQVPTFFTDDGTVLYDSRVICEYLDTLAGGNRLFPAAGPRRWRALVAQARGDGVLTAALLARYESILRPPAQQSTAWQDAQMDKVRCALDDMAATIAEDGGRVDIGTITTACALGYLDFRFPEEDWRTPRPLLAQWYGTFAARPALARTVPAA